MEPRDAGRDALPAVGSMTMEEIERAMIVKSMKHLGGNITRVAESLGLSRAALYRRFEKYGIELLASVDTILFGRVTYELMAGYWPSASPAADDPRIIEAMNRLPKVVFSRTLASARSTAGTSSGCEDRARPSRSSYQPMTPAGGTARYG